MEVILAKLSKAREKFWNDHIAGAEAFAGTIQKYCEENGLKKHQFGYHKTRLKKKLRIQGPQSSKNFAKVEITTPKPKSAATLPDPKWLSEFLRNFLEVSR